MGRVMDGRRKVELFEQIPTGVSVWSRNGSDVAKKLAVLRRMVQQVLVSAVPPERKVQIRAKGDWGR
jgi:hypothetical protein